MPTDRSIMLPTGHDRWSVLAFAAAIFTSAFLLFQVQPLVSKQILPWFGGSPTVWTTCLLFFQTLLFIGYAYAHVSNALLRRKQQVLVHLVIIAVAFAFLNVLPNESQHGVVSNDPVWEILLMLSVSVGLPYFVLASTGPLLQAWFGYVLPGRAPYRLYALSNIGSLLALVTYPFFIEWLFDLPQQARIWSWGFVLVGLLCGIAAVGLWTTGTEESPESDAALIPACPRWRQYVSWLAWPAFTSIVLMATTNHVSTDVAAMPLLWVAPLALYLVTFVIAFDHPRWYRPTLIASLTLVAIYGTALVHRDGVGWIDLYDCGMTGRCIRLFAEPAAQESGKDDEESSQTGPRIYIGFAPFLVLNLAAMFGICLLCHGELARGRPHPRYLTSYYLMIAAGGALGGAAVTLVAPRIFDTYFEWTLCMFIATIATLGVVLHTLVNRAVGPDNELDESAEPALAPKLVLVVLLFPTAFVLLDMVEYLHAPKKGVQFQTRNFFGTLTIRERNPDDARMRNLVLLHGVTVHGSQFVAPERRGQPTTYYSTVSGVGRMLNYYRSKPPHGGIRIGDVGLGTGTLAAYAGAGDSICLYEIDPAIVDVATNGRWFTYVADCQARGAKCEIRFGDGRISLESERAAGQTPRYHVLVVDAFSGDAVPVHLLTTQAFELYVGRLTTVDSDGEDGALAVHVSNRYLDLERVVRGVAQHFGVKSVLIHSPRNAAQSFNSADWMILSRNESLLRELAPFAYTPDETPEPAILWTDTRSSLFDVLK